MRNRHAQIEAAPAAVRVSCGVWSSMAFDAESFRFSKKGGFRPPLMLVVVNDDAELRPQNFEAIQHIKTGIHAVIGDRVIPHQSHADAVVDLP